MSGTYALDAFGDTVAVTTDGTSFDGSSTMGMDAVSSNAGPRDWVYDPAATSDTHLYSRSPDNGGGNVPALPPPRRERDGLLPRSVPTRAHVRAGASLESVQSALDAATVTFQTYTPVQLAALGKLSAAGKPCTALASTLDSFDEGKIGPDHCSE